MVEVDVNKLIKLVLVLALLAFAWIGKIAVGEAFIGIIFLMILL